MMTRLSPLALALLLTGCSVGPDYLRPASWLPTAFSSAAPEPEAANPAVDARWWTLFADATLNELVDRALEHNADLRSAIARVEQAEAAAREAGADFFPTINGQAAGSNSKLSTQTATWSVNSPDILRSRSAALVTAYELDVWGRIRRSNEAARANLLASRYGRDAIRLSVAGLVSATYLNLRALDARLLLTRESLSSREESARLVKAQVDAGQVSPLDQYQADGALAALQAQLAELRRDRALAEHQLALLTGNPQLAIAAGDLRQMPLPPQPPAGLPANLVDNRPDIRQAEQRLIAANAGIGIAKAGYYPRFTLTGSLGSESRALSDLFGSGASTWSAGIGLLMPVLDYGRTTARVDQAKAINEQSLIAWQNALQTAYQEVRDALVRLREDGEAEAAQQQRVDNARQALAIANRRYEAGYASYLEVLAAELTSNDALQSAVVSRQARLNAAVDLFKALGGGWQDERDDSAAAPTTPERAS